MNLSNYTSYYEIFAGLSAALIGIDDITGYFISRIKNNYNLLKDQVDEVIRQCHNNIDYSQNSLIFLYADQNEDMPTEAIRNWQKKLLENIKVQTDILTKSEILLNNFKISVEEKYIKEQTIKISLYCFFYFLILICCGGFAQDIETFSAFRFTFVLTLFSYFTLGFISLRICREKGYGLRNCLALIVSIAFSTIVFYNLMPFSLRPAAEIVILLATFLTGFYALGLIYYRAIFWFLVVYPRNLAIVLGFTKRQVEGKEIYDFFQALQVNNPWGRG